MHLERLAALGQMTAQVSHEIKNSLMIIGGFARQVRNNLDRDLKQNREKLQIIIDEIRRLEELLTQVCAYAKIPELRKTPGDLNALIRKTCLLLEPCLHDKEIKLVLELEPILPLVEFDAEYLRRVLLNIAKNSLEAMCRGGTLTITSGWQGGLVFVRIADTGLGITPQLMTKIFHPFYSTKLKGSGLGLAISQQIVEAHQGRITIESEPHQGCRVTIFLKAES